MVEAEYLIDTNIFLESVESGKVKAVVTSFALHSIAIILEKLKGIESYRHFLKS